MNINEIIKIAKIKNVNGEVNKLRIKKNILSSPNPKEVIDSLSLRDLRYLDKEILKLKIDGYKNLYDYILKTHSENIYPKREDRKDIELALTWIENRNILYSFNWSAELLLYKLSNNKLVLDLALDNNCFKDFSPVINSKELALELVKRNRLDLLINSTIDILKLDIEGVPLIKKLLDNNIVPNIKGIQIGNKYYRYNSKNENDILFETIKDDKKVIDYLLNSNLDIKFRLDEDIDKNNWEELAIKCIKYKKISALMYGPEEFYSQLITLKNGEKIKLIEFFLNKDFPKISGEINDIDVIRILLSNKKNYLDLIISCSEKSLTKPCINGISALEYIISELINKDFAFVREIIKYLYLLEKMNDKISLIFSKYGMYLSPLDNTKKFGVDKDRGIISYLYRGYKIQTPLEYKPLITEFKFLFNDGKSDKGIIDSVISVFNSTVIVDRKTAIRDIKALIDFKKKNKEFNLVYDVASGAYFSSEKITLPNNKDFNVLAHEWGHLIHKLYDNAQMPETIKKYIPYTNNYYYTNTNDANMIFDEIDKEASSLFDKEASAEEFYNFICYKCGNPMLYKKEIKDEYNKLIGTKKLLLDAIKGNHFSKEVKITLARAAYGGVRTKYLSKESIDKYIEARTKAELREFVTKKYERDNAEFLCYENFIDAYYGGAIGNIKHYKKTVAPTCTHNIGYFNDVSIQFSEMFANYVELKKSPNGYKYIERLRKKTSNELINVIDKYYTNLSYTKENEIEIDYGFNKH